MEGITGVDHKHANNVFEKFKLKHLGEYQDLYVQSDTLLRADVFENFRDKCIEIYELDSAHFLSASGLAWQACLKITSAELELLTDVDMMLMVKKGIRGGIYLAIHRFAKANNKYMIYHDKNKETSYIIYLDAMSMSIFRWAMSQKLPVNGFNWVKNVSTKVS